MDNEDFIKGLPPELQEKARGCKDTEELVAFIREEGYPLPDEMLAPLAGGANTEKVGNACPWSCPRCGSTDTYDDGGGETGGYPVACYCATCRYSWIIYGE